MKKTNLVVLALGLILMVQGSIFAGELVVDHELGTTTVPLNPENVVVFDYGVLDALDVLGVAVAGLPASNLPPFLSQFGTDEYVNVGTLFEPDFEEIYVLNPELIIISGRQADQYEELSHIAPTIYVAIDNSDFWGSLQSNLRLLGSVFEKEEEVETHLAELQERVDDLAAVASASELEALILMANDGALSVYGAESRFGFIHQELGFVPADLEIDDATHGQNVSFEYLLRINPEVIFVIDRAAIAGGSVTAQQVLNNPLVHMTNAYQEDQILYLNSQAWYVVSGGLRSTGFMLDDIEQLLR